MAFSLWTLSLDNQFLIDVLNNNFHFRTYKEIAVEISSQLGGGEKVEQLHNNAKEAKKIALKSLRNSLSEVLPWSLEEHLLDNILGHLNLLEEEEEANESWRLEIAEEEKPGLSSLYLHLSQIYSQIRTNLFIDFFAVPDH